MTKISKVKSCDLKEIASIESKRMKSILGEEFFSRIVDDPSYLFLKLEEDNIIGYALFSINGNESELYSIAVDSSYEGQGKGSELLEKGIEILKEKGIERIFLEVRESNIRANNLYTKNGFKYQRTRKGYYSNGEDAYCLCKEINDER